jgi:peptidoglycan hydrolase-like protein with peptidoglycan-binding domain
VVVPPVVVPPVVTPPVATPPVDPVEEVPFEPPVEMKQPTLRKGDKSQDRWVEYAQLLLNFHLNAGLKEDGIFGNAMLAAVRRFQKEKKDTAGQPIQVDGIIGHQTWAALREGAPEKPSTDGRKPHTYVEKGAEARWVFESRLNNRYDEAPDLLTLAVETVGDTPIDAATEAIVRVSAPGAKPKTVKARLGPPTPGRQGGIGFTHEVNLEQFRKRFPSVPVDAPVTEYLVEAYLPQELGGDRYSGKVWTE